MSDEPENNATVATAAPQEAPPAESSAQFRDPTPAEIEAHLASLSHDDLKKYNAYNAHVSRLAQEAHNRQAEIDAELTHYKSAYTEAVMSAWDGYFRQFNPVQRAQLLEQDAQMAANYAAVQNWKVNKASGRPISGGAAAADIVAGLKKNLQSDEEWGKIVTEELWEEVLATPDPAKALKKIIDAGKGSFSKADETTLKAELAAKLASEHGNTTEPSQPTGATGSFAGGPQADRRTLESSATSVEEKRAAFRRVHGFEAPSY